MIVLMIGLGLIVGFSFVEFVGIAPGGLVVPGYIAFFWDQPFRVLMTMFGGFATYIVVLILSRYFILYSRRRFMAAVIIGFFIGWGLESLSFIIPLQQDLRVIGFIIPGLIGNTMVKQGVINTVVATILAAAIVRLLVLLFIGQVI